MKFHKYFHLKVKKIDINNKKKSEILVAKDNTLWITFDKKAILHETKVPPKNTPKKQTVITFIQELEQLYKEVAEIPDINRRRRSPPDFKLLLPLFEDLEKDIKLNKFRKNDIMVEFFNKPKITLYKIAVLHINAIHKVLEERKVYYILQINDDILWFLNTLSQLDDNYIRKHLDIRHLAYANKKGFKLSKIYKHHLTFRHLKNIATAYDYFDKVEGGNYLTSMMCFYHYFRHNVIRYCNNHPEHQKEYEEHPFFSKKFVSYY